MQTRADFPIGTTVKFSESGQKAEIVSIEEYEKQHGDTEYGGPDTVFVRMGGLVQKTNVEKIERS